jgi:NAD-dependent deacetylase
VTVDLADRVSEWLRTADLVTVLTGAGISTDSGIPDFRGPQGVWTKNPKAERLSTLQDYLADPAVRVEAWRRRVDNPTWEAKPNAAHRALASLELDGIVDTVITQNIDGLHQKAGSTRVIEIHGTAWETECMSCGDRRPMPEAIERVRAGETDPPCGRCGGILKSATISFGQSLDADVLAAAERATLACDLFIAIGTSLQVFPAAGLCDVARSVGAKLVVINAQPTPYDDVADAVLRDPIGEVLPRLVS